MEPQSDSVSVSVNTYQPLATLDAELRDTVVEGLKFYRMSKAAEEQAAEYKTESKMRLEPALIVLGQGVGVEVQDVVSGEVAKLFMHPGTRSALNQQKLRGLLLDKLAMVPMIGDILTKCFDDATTYSANPYPVVKITKSK